MCPGDDRDIKIFTGSKVASPDDPELLAQDIEHHRENGNMDRAKRLGERMSALNPDSADIRELAGYKALPLSVLYQMRILMIFTAMTTIDISLPVNILSSAATTEMTNCLLETSKNFYDNISDGGAFTFYYLILRKGVDVPRNIGIQFASLCGKDNDEYYIGLGESIYNKIYNDINKMINELGFVF
ncbi:MAG: hypothetical protein K5756_03375 [Clostridiales bacterium]|nr:hypothetical protein [Clostridiales bacterium]